MKKNIGRFLATGFITAALLVSNLVFCGFAGTSAESHVYDIQVQTETANCFFSELSDENGKLTGMAVVQHNAAASFDIAFEIYDSVTGVMTTSASGVTFTNGSKLTAFGPMVYGYDNISVDGTQGDVDVVITYGDIELTIYIRQWPEFGMAGVHPEIPSSCTSEGTQEYWQCQTCGQIFLDSQAITMCNDENDLSLPTLPHSIDTVVSWDDSHTSCSLARSCTSCTFYEQIDSDYVSSRILNNGSFEFTAHFDGFDDEVFVDEADGIRSFSARLFTAALERDLDVDGFLYWVDVLHSGADGAAVARSFLYSEEVLTSGLSDEDMIGRIYLTLLGRSPSSAEVAYWVEGLKSGGTYDDLFNAFANSPEWETICASAGINSGSTNSKLYRFVNNMYTNCLGRNASTAELTYWVETLKSGNINGKTLARNFIFSDEFYAQETTNEEYVRVLYSVFLGRSPASTETYWVEQLNSGMARDIVFNGFSSSPEFVTICSNYGINP